MTHPNMRHRMRCTTSTLTCKTWRWERPWRCTGRGIRYGMRGGLLRSMWRRNSSRFFIFWMRNSWCTMQGTTRSVKAVRFFFLFVKIHMLRRLDFFLLGLSIIYYHFLYIVIVIKFSFSYSYIYTYIHPCIYVYIYTYTYTYTYTYIYIYIIVFRMYFHRVWLKHQ